MTQLDMWFGTAEEPKARAKGADGGTGRGVAQPVTYEAPKPSHKGKQKSSPMMEAVATRLYEAFQNVASNKGAPGPDKQTIGEVREHLNEVVRSLTVSLLEGTYVPGDIRRVWIPKGGGGQRGLGIPNVIDRMVQEAVRLVLEPMYEPTFHASSHGFRPGRSCQTAIEQAKGYLDEGLEWVVDFDLEKFFDRVNHQRAMARLAERVKDRSLLKLIGRMLKARVVMPDGVVVSTEEGVPQGGPLSPLLSNIVLTELDEELSRRGHRFVRYADDCNIYVRSERAGQRVMASVTDFIERRMRLKVNKAKSAVAHPEDRHFLGFRLRRRAEDGEVEVLLSERSTERLKATIQEKTPRNFGGSLRACIQGLNVYFQGWIGFFGTCTSAVEPELQRADAHTRRRLRAIQLKHWKRPSTTAKRLFQLGAPRQSTWRHVYAGRKSTWALSHSPPVNRGLRNAFFAERGLKSLAELWQDATRRFNGPKQEQFAWG
jgi:group II intron reverse transcriptase/maturase